MKTTIFTSGMSSSGCETRMVNALSNIEDIKKVKADAKTLIGEIGFEVLS
ncbi:MAG: heavy-metal-associated domain-containing protein [Spirochaetia bacterium]|nr:heavy-metal-associated domain-containing protein [Spirochaetia bacterium]